jgi:hypothetical protein
MSTTARMDESARSSSASHMTRGYDASGVVIETIARVTSLSAADRVCMESGIQI